MRSYREIDVLSLSQRESRYPDEAPMFIEKRSAARPRRQCCTRLNKSDAVLLPDARYNSLGKRSCHAFRVPYRIDSLTDFNA